MDVLYSMGNEFIVGERKHREDDSELSCKALDMGAVLAVLLRVGLSSLRNQLLASFQ